MVYEDVIVKTGQTLSGLANAYGYNTWDWKKIWDEPKNAKLKILRANPTKIAGGDTIVVPIPWKITKKIISAGKRHSNTFRIEIDRSGTNGKNIHWVQTVFDDNQPAQPPSSFSVDWIDDDEPYYWTRADLANDPTLHKRFWDEPFRPNRPTGRITNWRAVVSLCCTSGLRVSIIESLVWGIDFGINGINSAYPPRAATEQEITGHIHLLTIGKGQTKTFKSQGYTFRKARKI